jgi:hypothetical protein
MLPSHNRWGGIKWLIHVIPELSFFKLVVPPLQPSMVEPYPIQDTWFPSHLPLERIRLYLNLLGYNQGPQYSDTWPYTCARITTALSQKPSCRSHPNSPHPNTPTLQPPSPRCQGTVQVLSQMLTASSSTPSLSRSRRRRRGSPVSENGCMRSINYDQFNCSYGLVATCRAWNITGSTSLTDSHPKHDEYRYKGLLMSTWLHDSYLF